MAVVRDAGEYLRARAEGKHAAFIGIQGGSALDAPGALNRIPDRLVVRITLVHLYNSSLGVTSAPSVRDGGLTPAGKDYVRELDARRIFVDLAHIHRRGFFDAVEAHDRSLPLIVTHTGVSGVHEHWRNLDDEQLRAIADTGGTVGIMYHTGFLGPGAEGKRASRVVDHIAHVVKTVGDDHVSLGSDWDGAITTAARHADVPRATATRPSDARAGDARGDRAQGPRHELPARAAPPRGVTGDHPSTSSTGACINAGGASGRVSGSSSRSRSRGSAEGGGCVGGGASPGACAVGAGVTRRAPGSSTAPVRGEARRASDVTRAHRRVLDAAAHVRRAADANVEVVVVRQRPVRLLQHLGRAHADARRDAHLLGVREQAGAQRRGHEEVGHVRLGIGHERGDERPVLRVVEVRAGPARRGAVAAELDEVGGQELAPARALDEEADVRVAPALVRPMVVDVTASLARQVTHGGDRVGELAPHLARGAVDHRHERLEPPAYVAARVRRDDAQVRRLLEVRSAEEVPLGRRADASPEAERGGSHRADPRRRPVPDGRSRKGARRERQRRGEDRKGEGYGAHDD